MCPERCAFLTVSVIVLLWSGDVTLRPLAKNKVVMNWRIVLLKAAVQTGVQERVCESL